MCVCSHCFFYARVFTRCPRGWFWSLHGRRDFDGRLSRERLLLSATSAHAFVPSLPLGALSLNARSSPLHLNFFFLRGIARTKATHEVSGRGAWAIRRCQVRRRYTAISEQVAKATTRPHRGSGSFRPFARREENAYHWPTRYANILGTRRIESLASLALL